MDAVPIGRGICLSLSDFNGVRYFHIRRYYEGNPTKFGVALTSNETIFLSSRMSDVRLALESEHDRVYFGDNASLVISPREIVFEKNGKSVRVTRDQIAKIRGYLQHVLRKMIGVDSTDHEAMVASVKDGECYACGKTVTPDICGMYKCSGCSPPAF